ncbi:MAG: DUF937 domain-containing protein, partial [Acidobacteria bacterium]|nr:DUF937 domain-containing protein [Acidobacteriota bacterium]
MTTNLISQLSKEFSGDTLNRIAGAIGEDTSRTKSAIDGTLQALVGGLVSKGSTRDGSSDLLDLLRRNNFDGARYTNVASAISAPEGISSLIETGGPLLNSIFGARANSVIDWVTSLGGIKKSSASSLFGIALPLVLGQIGRLVSNSGWNVSSLMNLLGEQKSYLSSLPAGLASALGFGATDYGNYERRAAASPSYVREPERRESSWWKWVLPLLALLVLIPLLARLFSGREEQVQTNIAVPTPTVRVEVTPTATPIRVDLGAFIDKRLP